jgi:hypothetical protein
MVQSHGEHHQGEFLIDGGLARRIKPGQCQAYGNTTSDPPGALQVWMLGIFGRGRINLDPPASKSRHEHAACQNLD